MNWDDLRFFLAAARASTLTTAAARLGVNQTTVTRRLRALQDELGARLLVRTERGHALTEVGEAVLPIAEQMEFAAATLDRQVLGHDAQLSGRLRLTVIDWIAVFEPALMGAFARRYPGIELELSVSDAPRSLTRREADVAVRWTNAPPEHLVGREVARVEFALYAARALVGESGKGPELKRLPWLAWDEGKGARLTAAWMRRHVPDAPLACRYDSAMAMFAAVREGTGVAFLPCVYADAEPALRRLRPPEPGFAMGVWVLTHPELRVNARIRALIEHVVDHFRDDRASDDLG